MSKVLSISVIVLMVVGSAALADWFPGDGHKMHFPQLPDPFGWDVEFVSWSHEIADDWQCSESGPVEDIHFWTSWVADDVGFDDPTIIENITVKIYNDDRSGPFSQPGELLWSQAFTNYTVVSPYGMGDQGFYNPLHDEYDPHDHQMFQQVNITDIDDPFIQEVDKIYWLGIYIDWVGTQSAVGWKTSQDQFEDIAVWYDYILDVWVPLNDPVDGYRLDLAFVITPEPATLGLLVIGGLLMLKRRR